MIPGLERATVSRYIRFELAGPPAHQDTVVCAATATYVGMCAGLSALTDDPETGNWWIDLHVLTEPGADVRLVYQPAGSPPNYIELAAVGGADDPEAVQLVVASEQADATLAVDG